MSPLWTVRLQSDKAGSAAAEGGTLYAATSQLTGGASAAACNGAEY